MRIREIVEKRKTVKAVVGSLPYIEIGDIDTNTKDYPLKDKGAVPGSVLACKGDILVSTVRPTRGAITIVRDESPAVSSAFAVLKPNEKLCMTRYLFYCLCGKSFLQYLGANSKGATYPTCSKDDVLDYEFKVAGLSEQAEIVKRLDTVSGIITKYQQELAALDDLIKARFVEMFGNPKTNPNNYKTVPFEYVVEYMGDIGSNGANKVVVDHLDMKDEEDYALMVRFLNFTKNDFSDDVKYISKEAYEFFKKSQLFGGELIICKIGSAGLNYVMPYLNRPVSLGLNQIMVRITDEVMMPYLYQYLHTDYGEQLISGCINGAVTKSITKTELKKIPVVLPPKEEQNEFSIFVEQVDKSKVEVQKALENTQLLFDSLMQKYFG